MVHVNTDASRTLQVNESKLQVPHKSLKEKKQTVDYAQGTHKLSSFGFATTRFGGSPAPSCLSYQGISGAWPPQTPAMGSCLAQVIKLAHHVSHEFTPQFDAAARVPPPENADLI